MVEAVRTTTSTFGIWAIIVVAVVVLAIWLVGVSVADNIQIRESRRWKRMQAAAPEPEPAMASAGVSEVPGQRRGDEQAAERSAIGHQDAAGRHAKPTQPTLDGAGDFRRDAAEADWRTDAPTRPDLPAQAAPTGRHAMPAQRTGDTDRTERALADPGHQDDDSSQK